MYLAPGERVTVEELLYGLLLCSGNDAALALAEGCCGSVEAFVEEMNRKAAALGMDGTSFANPNGLDDPQHYSTAADMARLASCAVQDPLFVRFASTIQVATAGRTMSNHNRLLRTVDGCIGLKTGYTMAAGRTLVSCVTRGGRTLVAVTLQDGNDWADHQMLFDYGFSTYPAQRGAVLGQVVTRTAVENGLERTVPLVAADSFRWPLAAGEKLERRIDLTQPLCAPVKAGTRVGETVFLLNGREIGRVGLLCGADVLPKATSAMHTLKLYLPQ